KVLGPRLASFVPAHPIAGKETAGVQSADALLYQGRQVILTPLPQTDAAMVQKATDLWSALGCQVLKMTPQNHDAAFAAVSHLPHLLAFAYFSAVANQAAGRDFLSLAGPGFRDFTRIAASDPQVWRDIFMANKTEVLAQSRQFRAVLDQMEQAIQAQDAKALENLLRPVSEARGKWQLGQLGPLSTAKPR
ncbi:MAG: prephenate dehydrogenase/arogenate dehydrogenase family protein, partial [Paucibacter sp.]|nr:prephenate dehydrogenase/arogenate dehydrogenase family protein [Roseateles sp.]